MESGERREILMPHASFHASQPETIVLIAGAGTVGSSATTFFRSAISNLPDHHILVPFLPKSISLPAVSSEIAGLIHTRGKTKESSGKAHVVGFSLGTHLAVYLAKEHPDVVESVFVTGFNRIDRSKFWVPAAPYLWWGIEGLGRVLSVTKQGGPDASASKAEGTADRDIEDSPEAAKRNVDSDDQKGLDLPTCKATIAILSSWDELPSLKPKTLVVAATKGHFGLPTGDSVATAMELYSACKLGNEKSMFIEGDRWRHAWPFEQPESFARCVEGWVTGPEALPRDV